MSEPTIIRVEISICTLCLGGAEGECHVPGCWFWMCQAPSKDQADRIRDWAFVEVVTGRSTDERANA